MAAEGTSCSQRHVALGDLAHLAPQRGQGSQSPLSSAIVAARLPRWQSPAWGTQRGGTHTKSWSPSPEKFEFCSRFVQILLIAAFGKPLFGVTQKAGFLLTTPRNAFENHAKARARSGQRQNLIDDSEKPWSAPSAPRFFYCACEGYSRSVGFSEEPLFLIFPSMPPMAVVPSLFTITPPLPVFPNSPGRTIAPEFWVLSK